ncbi:serine-rich adhesin for platelets [Drosophila grimshawi]|uniref:serine-rich adhesin for platelets n=1 Tax=Drosophila grimshawi TaxID=7222 RepID=UPI000C86EAC4|nr:serine-rich adhesin for platelets [Drosophila grimshawi]
MRKTLPAKRAAHCNQKLRPATCRTLGYNVAAMLPQTSPQWRQSAGNERTKDAVSVITARNCATGTAETDSTSSRASPVSPARTSRSDSASKLTTAKMTFATVAGHQQQQRQRQQQKHRRQFVRTSRTITWQHIWLATRLLIVLAAVNLGTHLVTCDSAYVQAIATEPQLTTYPRSTLSDSPMTAQNDLITTARNSTTLLKAKKPTTATAATTTGTTTRTTTTTGGNGNATLGMSSTAATITATTNTTTTPASTEAEAKAAAAAPPTKSAQISLTTQPTTAAKTQTAATTTRMMALKSTSTSTSTMPTMFISTIYPASTKQPATPATGQIVTPTAATTTTTTEADAHNSIETAMLLQMEQVEQKHDANGEQEQDDEQQAGEEVESGMLQNSHPVNADSLTKGFSIPTFLPPFPVFAAADLPAYRAAADAAEAAAAAVAAEAAAAASTLTPETVTLSPEQQRQQMFNEQHSYLASHNGALLPGQQPLRNLTMPVLNITAQMGNHAYMPCQIHRLSDKPVSWVRLSDGHIISVDESTFIGDERFQSIYQEHGDYTWSLQIKYVETSDAGWYECQMATEPKLSAKVHLEVIRPKTELIGDQTRFVKAGSKVALHCIVRGTLDPPKYIIWFRGQKKISESDERSGWYTQLDRNIFGTVGDNQNTIGSLIIPFVRKEDSGNYTCQPSNSVSVSVDLHVLSGEYSASAIMSGVAERTKRSTFLLLLLVLVLVLRQPRLWLGGRGCTDWLVVSKTLPVT